MDETKIDPKTLFDNSEEWVALTKEQLDEWANKKYPWYQELWWAIRRIPDKIDFIISSKDKLEKEHKEIGLNYWDRPVKKYENWNPFLHLAWTIYPKLVRYKRSVRHGIPQGVPGSTFEEKQIEWEIIIDKMVYAFQEILLDEYIGRSKYTNIEEIIENANKVQEGLDLFAKYFRDLWD